MNLFKGLLYLIETDQPASPVLIDAPHYGAATAASEFGGELGNRAASERRFGPRHDAQDVQIYTPIGAIGGCPADTARFTPLQSRDDGEGRRERPSWRGRQHAQ